MTSKHFLIFHFADLLMPGSLCADIRNQAQRALISPQANVEHWMRMVHVKVLRQKLKVSRPGGLLPAETLVVIHTHQAQSARVQTQCHFRSMCEWTQVKRGHSQGVAMTSSWRWPRFRTLHGSRLQLSVVECHFWLCSTVNLPEALMGGGGLGSLLGMGGQMGQILSKRWFELTDAEVILPAY